MIREKGMRIAESTFNITNWIFYNISASDTTSFVDAGINTIVYLIKHYLLKLNVTIYGDKCG